VDSEGQEARIDHRRNYNLTSGAKRFKSVAISGLVNECAHVSAHTRTGCIVSGIGCSEGIILVEGLPRGPREQQKEWKKRSRSRTGGIKRGLEDGKGKYRVYTTDTNDTSRIEQRADGEE